MSLMNFRTKCDFPNSEPFSDCLDRDLIDLAHGMFGYFLSFWKRNVNPLMPGGNKKVTHS